MPDGSDSIKLGLHAVVKTKIEKWRARERESERVRGGKGEKANTDRFCTMIGKRSNCDSITSGPGPWAPATHNAAATRGSCQPHRSLGGN